MTDERNALFSHLPAHSLRDVEAIRAHFAGEPHDQKPKKKKPASTTTPDHAKPVSRDAHAMTKGELRLAQSYLSVMNYFGAPGTVKGNDVVHGRLDKRTEKILHQFAVDHRLATDCPTRELLAEIEHAYSAYVKDSALPILQSSTPSAQQRIELALTFEKERPRDNAQRIANWEVIHKLHPVMRFPAWKAVEELRQAGVPVTCLEGYRPAENQKELVMHGKSNSPPGFSFHGIGLAIDIEPVRKRGVNFTSQKDKRWQKAYDVMEKYGFYCMFREDGWDAPHHEMPAKTRELINWPTHSDGWKDIPENKIPEKWKTINQQAVQHARETPVLPRFMPFSKAASGRY